MCANCQDCVLCMQSQSPSDMWTTRPPTLCRVFYEKEEVLHKKWHVTFRAEIWLKWTLILCDEFIWEIWLISETWLDCSKLTYNTCNSTNKGSKNWSITFKGHKAVLLKAILAKTSNFWPIGPIELKFWHLVHKMIHFNISLRRSHGSSFRPLWWLLLGPQRSKKLKNQLGTIFGLILAYL